MALARRIGRWSMTALIVNTVIGSGIFGLPSELTQTVGRASPLAVLAGGIAVALMMACFAEVASQFSEAGGSYLYVREAFGRFAGIQVAWFGWLAPMAACAATANLFATYAAGAVVAPEHEGVARAALIVVLFAAVAVANVSGVESGTRVSNVLTIAKLLPLLAIIAVGWIAFLRHSVPLPAAEIAAPGWRRWAESLLIIAFAFEGFECALVPAGEVRDARRTVPQALLIALVICTAMYAALQFIVVATLGTTASARPLADVAAVFFGASGRTVVTIAAIVSTCGSVAAMSLAVPRLTFSLAERGDFPKIFARLSRRQTPDFSIVMFAALACILALSGTFRWALEIASGAVLLEYAMVCAALIRLRRVAPGRERLRIPAGEFVAVVCIAMVAVLLTRLTAREAMLLLATAAVAAVNWVVARRRS